VGIFRRRTLCWDIIRRNLVKMILLTGVLVSLRFLALLLIIQAIAFIKKRILLNKKVFEANEVARKHKIPYFEVTNINSKGSLKILKKLKPDLIISNYFDQIMKRKVLDIPIKGTINIHPGLLPQYRGIFPYFWKLANREKIAGVTIHFVNEAIDKGRILAEKTFKITKADTAMDLVIRGAQMGSKILDQTLKNIKYGKPKGVKVEVEGGYYTYPDKEALRRFYQNGRKWISFKNFYQYL